ncbi:MAG: sugar ABC transporter ATP-binding protein [Isosphaeraceae bacterium]|nr:sugar ABC transporter ATP-binding protein [Isosphaeraceae bacterium]
MNSFSQPPYPLVSVRGLSRAFNGVPALSNIDVDFFAGETHALCGENGAGKSTLIEILAGSLERDSGIIAIEGALVDFRSPRDAMGRGIAVIHQEFSLIDEMSVAENLMLGHEPRSGPWISRLELRNQAAEILDRHGFDLPLDERVGRLPTGRRQLVEIAKALSRDVRLLILDEPTAALNRPEAEALFRVVDELRARGIGIIYVSHHLDDVLRICDRITVLRDGRRITTRFARDFTPESLVDAMVGDSVEIRPRPERLDKLGAVVIEARRLGARVLDDVSFTVRAGEVVGVTGLAGAGHEELARILAGTVRPSVGEIIVDGVARRFRGPRDAAALGIASIPADRRREGLLTSLDVDRNLTIPRLRDFTRLGLVDRRRRTARARELATEFDVALARIDQNVTTLSGGNQQKVVLARWSSVAPRILIFQDPTRGIDIKARESIHRRIELAAEAGTAILITTSDAQELRRLADRVIVIRKGRIALETGTDHVDERTLIAAMTDTASASPSPSAPEIST